MGCLFRLVLFIIVLIALVLGGLFVLSEWRDFVTIVTRAIFGVFNRDPRKPSSPDDPEDARRFTLSGPNAQGHEGGRSCV